MPMKRLQLIIMIFAILSVTVAPVFASPTAERQFATVQAQDLGSQSLEEIRKSYDTLNEAIAREAQDARKAMADARSKGDRNAYLEAYQNLNTLSSFQMDQKTSDHILTLLLGLSEDQKDEAASWLYQNSLYYRPTLTLDFSAEGPNYRYSYRQQVRRQPGSEIRLPDASQIRLNSAHLGVLVGWGLTPDEVSYEPGETIKMSYTNQTLYAIYSQGVRFVDAKSNTDLLLEGEEIEVPTPVSSDGSAVFAGWYDRTTGRMITDEPTIVVEGKGAHFEALWKALEINQVDTLYYNHEALPTNTQLAVGFTYRNTGTVDLSSLKAKLSSESPYVRFLVDELDLGRLSVGYASTNNSRWATKSEQNIRGEGNTFRFVIASDAPSSTVIPFTLTITNDKGDSWTKQFECVVR